MSASHGECLHDIRLPLVNLNYGSTLPPMKGSGMLIPKYELNSCLEWGLVLVQVDEIIRALLPVGGD
jgi:hypothetical protein